MASGGGLFPRPVSVCEPGDWILYPATEGSLQALAAYPNDKITRPCQVHHPPKSACGKTSSAVSRNRVTKKVIKTLEQAVDGVAGANDLDKAATDIKAAASKIDKAGARRVLHPNTAARRKSKLARAYNAAVAKSQQA